MPARQRSRARRSTEIVAAPERPPPTTIVRSPANAFRASDGGDQPAGEAEVKALVDLPEDVIWRIAVMLPARDFARLALASRACRAAASDEHIAAIIPTEAARRLVAGKRVGDDFCQRCPILELPAASGISTVGVFAFERCSSLREVRLPSGITSLGNRAFYGCAALERIVLPRELLTIGSNAFSGCAALSSLGLPAGLTTIGKAAFSGCTSLASIVLPSRITSIPDSAFGNCTSLRSVTLPTAVHALGDCCFYNCSSLASIELPRSLSSIGSYAFFDCASLSNIRLPANVAIRGGAFCSCTALDDESRQRIRDVDEEALSASL